ncbi:hypothetical protein AVEN_49183-1 [Araneus ventricosus]|uniref:DUF7041 domain-containing protein n=1 Tax=Araneus ventricosus TaxID=182803 RepID=A0A4Y2J4D2_ARAVE|nr:hypothetical protein AVEN_49183-1 [Araneus ventricosus]
MNDTGDSWNVKFVSNFEQFRIAVKVPPLWRENPAICFLQLESQFITSGIVEDSTKYHTVVASDYKQVIDIVTSSNCYAYKTIKDRLIIIFTDSEECRFKKLLG